MQQITHTTSQSKLWIFHSWQHVQWYIKYSKQNQRIASKIRTTGLTIKEIVINWRQEAEKKK